MKEVITQLRSEATELQNKLRDVERAILALQKLCQHEWKPVGNDSHKDYQECSICKKTQSI